MSEKEKNVASELANLNQRAVMEEPEQVLPQDAKFMTPEKTLLSGSPIASDPHLFLITLKHWADFLRFLEPISRKIFGSDPPTPNLPVFYKIYDESRSEKVIITFMALSGFRKKSLLSYSFNIKMNNNELNARLSPDKPWVKNDTKKSDKINRKIRALEKAGYIVVQGDIDPYF